MRFPPFPITPDSPRPGPQHSSIEEVLETTNEDGTRSILDIMAVAQAPFDGNGMPFTTVYPLSESVLLELFADVRPTRRAVEGKLFELLDRVERGSSVYVALYSDGKPQELLFAGISFD
jgi:hypothetical protein